MATRTSKRKDTVPDNDQLIIAPETADVTVTDQSTEPLPDATAEAYEAVELVAVESSAPDETVTPDEAQNAPVSADNPAPGEDTEEAAKAPENAAETPDMGEDSEPSDPAAAAADTTEDQDEEPCVLTLSLPRKHFTPSAIERLKALVQSKQTLLKKVFGATELPIILTEDQIQFPWFTLAHVDGEIDAYSKFIFAIARRALTSSRVSAYEKPTDNEKFTMRLFLNNLGFKGEEYRFARRFLLRNLEGDGAWRYGNAPDKAEVDLEMPTVVQPTVAQTTAIQQVDGTNEEDSTDETEPNPD